ncbi:MAG TPA: glycosyltransferase [Candidatus Nanoarchaeia archaeon]
MRIAFFTDNYHPQISGVVEQVETSAKALRELGHEVFIVAPKTPGYKSNEKDVFWIPSIKVNRNPEYRFIVPLPDTEMRKLLTQKFDVVHSHGGVISFLAWEIARRKKIPYIYTYHTLLNRYTHYLFNGKIVTPKMAEIASRVFCNLSDRVIAPTEAVKRELVRYGVKKPISVVAGGINLKKFAPAEKGFLRKKYGTAASKVILLYVGRVGKEKNIEFILRSYARLIKTVDSTILFIVGDGTEKAILEKTAKNLSLGKNVIFTGFVDMGEVPKVYADGDIFLFSSQSETQGLVVAEAMSQGLPVVCVKDGAFEDVVVDGETGFATKKDTKEYSEAILRLVNDKKLREELGENARALVRSEYSDQRQAEKLTEVYKQALKETLDKTEPGSLIRQRVLNLNLFIKMSERFNRFTQVMKLPKWY